MKQENKENRKATLKEITVWHKFRPSFDIWTSKYKCKTTCFLIPYESWYGGYWFYRGWYAFINLKFITIHINLSWWKIDFKNII